ncbi:unnamed protein product [Diabrotica balteata]|uniref:Uncharacterized protein n=1 Tax=Diabrotica balteata TaxID=107213 RepID=A0A9N9SSA2_DIABA|nr:unnamed protein product [Diabrotica balteata]
MINMNKHAYQEGKSTETTLDEVVQKLSMSTRETALAAVLDIEGAFNNALPNYLYDAGVSKEISATVYN